VACVAFFSFFRLEEVLHEAVGSFDPATGLAWGDVALGNHQHPRMAQIHLKKSKCNQFGSGVDNILRATDNDISPVTAFTQFVPKRGSIFFFFFFLQGHRGSSHEGLVCERDPGSPSQVRATPVLICGHSFRIMAATTAALAGLEDSNIQLLGRWHSPAFLRYLRTPKERLAATIRTTSP